MMDFTRGTYEGNEVKKILKNVDEFQKILPGNLHDFCLTLRSIADLDAGVSGSTLSVNYAELIQNFSQCWLTLHSKFGISISNKVHIIMCHLEHYCTLTGNSLGHCSDQKVEQAHQLFHKRVVASNYKIKSITSPNFGSKFFRAVIHYNSSFL